MGRIVSAVVERARGAKRWTRDGPREEVVVEGRNVGRGGLARRAGLGGWDDYKKEGRVLGQRENKVLDSGERCFRM